MKDKKGFLLAEETLKMLIAVISLTVLIYFLTSLYFAKVGEQEKKQAEATMSRISSIIDNLQITSEIVSDVTPVGWSFFSYVGDIKPNSCAEQNCLCLCDSVVGVPFTDRQLSNCDEKGICKIVTNLKGFEKIKIEASPFVLEIKKESGGVIIQRK